jgi:outer membrane biogenesis lipoprotein LolB
LKRAAALALAALATACAVAPVAESPLPQLSTVPPAFEMSGRLAVRQGERSEIARLRWTHRPSSDLWVIASPLGNEVARIESGPQGATLERAGAPTEEAASFTDLTERLLGVALDPAALVGWLHGSAPVQGGGWDVSVEESRPAGSIAIARRLSARREETTVRLVVDEYRALGSGP